MWSRRSGSHGSVELVLYTKPGCHLCDVMKAVVDRVVAKSLQGAITVREVDISADASLWSAYGEQIPVLFVNGRKAFKYRLTAEALRDRVRRELTQPPT